MKNKPIIIAPCYTTHNPKNATIVPVAQIVELGAVTELTLGGGTAGCEYLTKPAYA